MKTTLTLILLASVATLSCKPKGPLIEPKDNAGLATASPAATTRSAPLTR